MKIWYVGHSRDGWEISLTQVPWWAIVVEDAYGKLMELLHHPCCTAWGYSLLMDNRLACATWHYEKSRLRIPVTKEQAQALSPRFVKDLEFLDDRH